jgi:HNH endonuclease/NUMOD4 motif
MINNRLSITYIHAMVVFYSQTIGISNMSESMIENNIEWRSIPGYEGVYSVSNTGLLRSEPREVWGGRAFYNTPQKILKQWVTPDGYSLAGGHYNRKGIQLFVHICVCSAWHGPKPSPKHEVRHLDGDPTNNAIDNLAWGTRSQNIADAKRHGTFPVGVNRPGAKLSPDVAKSICLDTRSCADIAKDYTISEGTVRNIKIGKLWGGWTEEERRTNPWEFKQRFTEDDLALIKDKSNSRSDLAKMFCVSPQSIDAWRRKSCSPTKVKSRLSEEDKTFVKNSTLPRKELSKMFNISVGYISLIRGGCFDRV